MIIDLRRLPTTVVLFLSCSCSSLFVINDRNQSLYHIDIPSTTTTYEYERNQSIGEQMENALFILFQHKSIERKVLRADDSTHLRLPPEVFPQLPAVEPVQLFRDVQHFVAVQRRPLAFCRVGGRVLHHHARVEGSRHGHDGGRGTARHARADQRRLAVLPRSCAEEEIVLPRAVFGDELGGEEPLRCRLPHDVALVRALAVLRAGRHVVRDAIESLVHGAVPRRKRTERFGGRLRLARLEAGILAEQGVLH
mmetsp:Transcript_5095/g.12874  ORF Transcript_5095/g.12874 Transcript_5095/m.12874 type:complete len:252 (-) Transcript_5095:100-855(-)